MKEVENLMLEMRFAKGEKVHVLVALEKNRAAIKDAFFTIKDPEVPVDPVVLTVTQGLRAAKIPSLKIVPFRERLERRLTALLQAKEKVSMTVDLEDV